MKKKKRWYDYLWIGELLYLCLGLFNILFAWLGMLFFTIPLLTAIIGGNKTYCNRYCGRGQLLGMLGERLKLSRNTPPPRFLRSPLFRYGFLAFFMIMFCLMLYSTYKVFTGAPLQETVTLLWVFRLPWQWPEIGMVSPWFAQYAFGFFGVMLTSTVLGFITMVLFRPRSWCVYCPMGTMTQGICRLRHRKEETELGRTGKKNRGASEASGQ
nr:4Fe-4S binding protein [uncultured Acetatifactor sp.]